ncbi:zinc-binding dehydrogenase [Desulfocastanea catecholica]
MISSPSSTDVLNQKMPGNGIGINGGFSSYIPVPSIDLCEVKDRREISLEQLSVVADAGMTPFQAAKRVQHEIGDDEIVIGVGGVGQYMVQIAKALGAECVIVVDINKERLDKMLGYGVDVAINSMGKPIKDVVGEFKGIQKQLGLPGFGWRIFEVSGTRPGQAAALALLSFTGKLMIVGFGMQKVEYIISRLMAFDAEIIGTWGCLPEYFSVCGYGKWQVELPIPFCGPLLAILAVCGLIKEQFKRRLPEDVARYMTFQPNRLIRLKMAFYLFTTPLTLTRPAGKTKARDATSGPLSPSASPSSLFLPTEAPRDSSVPVDCCLQPKRLGGEILPVVFFDRIQVVFF